MDIYMKPLKRKMIPCPLQVGGYQGLAALHPGLYDHKKNLLPPLRSHTVLAGSRWATLRRLSRVYVACPIPWMI